MEKKKKAIIYARSTQNASITIHSLKHIIDEKLLLNFDFYLLVDFAEDYKIAKSMLGEKVQIRNIFWDINPLKPIEYSDEEVQIWEERYGVPNLMRYITGSRYVLSYGKERTWNYLFSFIKYFESLIKTIKPDVYIGAPDDAYAWLAFEMFKKNKIPTFGLTAGRIDGKFSIVDNYREILHIKKRYREILERGLTPDEIEVIRNIRKIYEQKRRPFYVFKEKTRILPRPSRVAEFIKGYTFGEDKLKEEPPSLILKRYMKIRLNPIYNKILERFFLSDLNKNESYFFYPLHFEPESAILLMGDLFKNQIAIIDAIDSTMPINHFLYIKEHPMMRASVRSIEFYAKVLKLMLFSRVRFLKQQISSYDVIKNSKGVISLSGTAGWEALIFGKPVILLGNAFYSEFEDGVIKVNNYYELFDAFKKIREIKIDSHKVDCFILAVLSVLHDGYIAEPRYFPNFKDLVLSKHNVSNVAKALAEAIRSRVG